MADTRAQQGAEQMKHQMDDVKLGELVHIQLHTTADLDAVTEELLDHIAEFWWDTYGDQELVASCDAAAKRLYELTLWKRQAASTADLQSGSDGRD